MNSIWLHALHVHVYIHVHVVLDTESACIEVCGWIDDRKVNKVEVVVQISCNTCIYTCNTYNM